MFGGPFSTASDYNRGLTAPVRWAHVVWVAVRPVWEVLFGWAWEAHRRHWGVPLVLGVVGAVAALRWDGRWQHAVQTSLRPALLRGDVARELEAIQQFGQGAMSLLIAAAIVLLDRERWRRVLDWAAGALVLAVVTNLVKAMLGRPRPKLDDPWGFVGPLGRYPLPVGDDGDGVFRMASGWTANYDLGSMPSRHAAFAALAAVFLAAMYPRVKPLVWGLAVVVAGARVAFDAHYVSDVLMGLGLGAGIGALAVRGYWGTRFLDWFWGRFVNRERVAVLPRLLEADARAGAAEPRIGGNW